MNMRMVMGIGALAVVAGRVDAQTRARATLTLEGARGVVAAAVAEARWLGAGGAVAVVDGGGHLLAFERIDGTFAAAANVSMGKARTAALFERPTSFFEDVITKKGRTSMVALPDFTPLQGGVPIVAGGEVVGAVGVSGAQSAAQDEEIAAMAAKSLDAVESPANGESRVVREIEGEMVRTAFAKGEPLVEVDAYKVHASRREKPGEAEIHSRDTDIIYVISGEATLVTGGSVIEPRDTADDEVRGRCIEGGDARELRAGDVLIVPHGVPHWFRRVDAPFVYFVVKVTSSVERGGAR